MNLFSRTNLKAEPEKIQQVKTWISEILNIDEKVTISLNQLRCHESDCPIIETAIAILEQPLKQYKIYKSITEIQRANIEQLKNK